MTLPANKGGVGGGCSSRDDLDPKRRGGDGRTSSDEGKKQGFLERELLLLLLHTALPLHSCVPVTKRACARACARARQRETGRKRGKGAC